MRIEDINQLWDRFDKSVASEMEIEMEGTRLVLKKSSVVSTPMQVVNPVIGINTNEDTVADITTNTVDEEDDLVYVRAPLVGTFYKAASPDSEPFVTVGQKVSKGDVVGIIEAMKLMNEISAPEDGVVAVIKAADGSMVKYDQILLGIKKE